jgi:hypothetical protein
MSVYQIDVTRCNKCGKNNMHDGAEFECSADSNRGQYDLCTECIEKGWYLKNRVGGGVSIGHEHDEVEE